MLYDIKFDKLIKAQKIYTKYNNKGIQNKYEYAKISKKRKTFAENTVSMSNDSRSVLCYNVNGYQSNRQELAVHKAVQRQYIQKNLIKMHRNVEKKVGIVV